MTDSDGVNHYVRFKEITVSCVPEDHPWYELFRVNVAWCKYPRVPGITGYAYELSLPGENGGLCPRADLPGEPKLVSPWGETWREAYDTSEKALARAFVVATRVTVDGHTWQEAMQMSFMTENGVWAP